jgi:hypothetical protein
VLTGRSSSGIKQIFTVFAPGLGERSLSRNWYICLYQMTIQCAA